MEVFVPQTVKLTTKDLKAERQKALAKRLQKQQQMDGRLGRHFKLLVVILTNEIYSKNFASATLS